MTCFHCIYMNAFYSYEDLSVMIHHIEALWITGISKYSSH